MTCVYLDNNATTQPADAVIDAIREVNTELWANPSSVHRFGQMVRQRLDLARADVAKLIGCRDRELIFTSGGTESNNLALKGVLVRPGSHDNRRRVLITTRMEHAAVREPAGELADALTVAYVPMDSQGRVDPDQFAAVLVEHAHPNSLTLVSVQWVNNETGVIQPVAELVECCRQYQQRTGSRVLFHTDATQAVGKITVDVKSAGIDLLTLSAHKFHGPKGIGGLFVRTGVRLRPQQLGGPHEREKRGGTENTAGIIGMGVAADLARSLIADVQTITGLTGMRDRFEQAICRAMADTVVNSGGAFRIWNTTNLGFPGLEAEAILLGLSERGVCASAGAACSSGSLEPSPVLLAMGVSEPVAHGSIRFSLSRFTSEEQIDRAIEVVPLVVRRLGRTLPVS